MLYEEGAIIRAHEHVLLNMLEGFPHNLPYLPEVSQRECWINGLGITGHLYLTYLTQKIFNIQRQPFCDERFRGMLDYSGAQKFFGCVNDITIAESMKELHRLYQHTQKILWSDSLDKYFRERKYGGIIKLKRGVGVDYAHAIIAHAMYAEKHGYQSIPISGDVNKLSTFDEEFIVINNNPLGIININIADIKFEYRYYENKLKGLIERIDLYSDQYFQNTYPKPNMLYEFHPRKLKEPKGVKLVKWIYDMIGKYKMI